MKKRKTFRKNSLKIAKAKQTVIVMPDEICVSCGSREYIPEGSIICSKCRKLLKEEKDSTLVF